MLQVNAAIKKYGTAKGWFAQDATDEVIRASFSKHVASGELPGGHLAALMENKDPEDGRDTLRTIIREELAGTRGGSGVTPAQLFGKSGTPSARYNRARTTAKHHKTGREVMLDGAPVQVPSQAETALAGAYWKRLMRRGGLPVRWEDHDEELWRELVNDHPWVSQQGDEPQVIPGGERVKALLDDSTSGGANINPVVVDDLLLSQLVLYGEVSPYCDIKDVGRGRIIRTGLLGRAAVTWGIPDSTAAPIMDTTGILGSVDRTIFDLKGAIEFGNDLASDTALNISDLLTQGIRENMNVALDHAVTVGDGTTMPLGLSNTSGLTVVASANGAAGPLTMGDLEALVFSVAKPYRAPGMGGCFVGNDINYRRCRTIPVATGWNERLFGGGTEQEYTVMGYPYRVAPDLPNTTLLFVCLSRYRLYRRMGVETRLVTTGRELALRNVSMILAIARFGGGLWDSHAGAIMTTLSP